VRVGSWRPSRQQRQLFLSQTGSGMQVLERLAGQRAVDVVAMPNGRGACRLQLQKSPRTRLRTASRAVAAVMRAAAAPSRPPSPAPSRYRSPPHRPYPGAWPCPASPPARATCAICALAISSSVSTASTAPTASKWRIS